MVKTKSVKRIQNKRSRKFPLSQTLLRWYRKKARPLPWRKTHNPYRILVSEIMLQQTQVHRVLQIYPKFLKQFPDFQSLAHAGTAGVIRAWAGMGYNNRAIHLHRTAKIISEEYSSRLPDAIDTLLGFPGIGKYTAHAVACFAFGRQTPVVDTNVRRVFSRLFPKQFRTDREWEFAEKIMAKRNAYEWNQALMELGGTLCTSALPHCASCPLNSNCPSAFLTVRRKKINHIKNRSARIPDRIYRGRVVAALRTSRKKHGMNSNSLLRTIRPNDAHRNRTWFLQILKRLERDGLIHISSRHSEKYISLAP